jgi:hypothetical protein
VFSGEGILVRALVKVCVQAVLACLVLLFSTSVQAQEKTGTKPGFIMKPGTVRIVLMRPTVRVGAQSTGGTFDPNADWTASARDFIGKALRANQGRLGNVVVDYDEGLSGEGQVATQYSNLFGTVADSVIEYQFFPGNRLPTKSGAIHLSGVWEVACPL